jgi:hypothetical protein
MVPEMPVWTLRVMTMKDWNNVVLIIKIYKNRTPQKLALYAFLAGNK